MTNLVLKLQGRFGNQVMQYLFAKAWCTKTSTMLYCEPWIGERVFQCECWRPTKDMDVCRYVHELDLVHNPGDLLREETVALRCYAQMQDCMIYTAAHARQWLRFQPWVESLADTDIFDAKVVCHLRRGDYAGYGYPVVSKASYVMALQRYGFDLSEVAYLSEETAVCPAGVSEQLSFIVDFVRMVRAPVLLRANSSFSWVAGLLSKGLVLSPVMEGALSGVENSVPFVMGNHPRFTTHLDFITDLHVPTRYETIR